MFTPRNEYIDLLRNMDTASAEALGRYMFTDLVYLGTVPQTSEIFSNTINRLRTMKRVTPARLASVVTSATRKASRLLNDVDTNVFDKWDPDALYRVYQVLIDLKDARIPVRVPETEIQRYIDTLQSIRSKYNITPQEQSLYRDWLARKIPDSPATLSVVSKIESLGRELQHLDATFPAIKSLVSNRFTVFDPWNPVTGMYERFKVASELRKEAVSTRVITQEIISSAMQEAHIAYNELGLQEGVPTDAMPMVSLQGNRYTRADAVLSGTTSGTPSQIRAKIDEERTGYSSLQAYMRQQREALREFEIGGDELEEIVRGWDRDVKGIERARMEIGKRAERLAKSPPAEGTQSELLWRQALEEKTPIHIPGSPVPYTVRSIDASSGKVVLQSVTRPAEGIEAHIEFLPGTELKELRQVLERLKVAKQEVKAHAGILPGELTSLRGQVIDLLTDGDVADERIADLAKRLLSETPTDKELTQFLYDIAILHAPWAQRHLNRDDIISSSWIAFNDVMRNKMVDVSGKSALTRDIITSQFATSVTRRSYSSKLLKNLFDSLPEQSGEFNAIADLISYIQNNIKVGDTARTLSDLEAARLLKESISEIGSEAPAYLARIARLQPAEIVASARLGSADTVLSFDDLMHKAAQQASEIAMQHSLESFKREESMAQDLADQIFANIISAADVYDDPTLDQVFSRSAERFFRRYQDKIQDLISTREDYQQFRKHLLRLRAAFIREVGEDELSSFDRYILARAKLPYTTSGITVTADSIDVIRNLLTLQQETGARLRVNFYRLTSEGEHVPISLALRDDTIIGIDLVTRERFTIGPINTITSNIATTPIPSKVYQNLEYAGPEISSPVLVRSVGLPFQELITPTSDLPDVTLQNFRSIRSMRPGERIGIAALDWETTTLPDKGLPFYPIELGIAGDILERREHGYGRRAVYRKNILIRPSEEVVSAVNQIRANVAYKKPISEKELQFLGNIAKFADPEAFKLSQKPLNSLTPGEISRLAEAAERGVELLAEKGVRLPVALRRLERMLTRVEDKGGQLILVGQNIIGAEYNWTLHFAELAEFNAQQLQSFTESIDRFFQNRIDNIFLDRFMSAGRVTGSTLDEQVPRYIARVLSGEEELSLGMSSVLRRMASTPAGGIPLLPEEVQHRAGLDAVQELAIAYSHIGRDTPVGDIRSLSVGDYVVRTRVRGVIDPYAPAEYGRPVRGTFRVADISKTNTGRYELQLERLDIEGKHIVPTGDIQVVRAENPLELARRFHEEYTVLRGEKDVLRVQQEIVEDYARREVIKATSDVRKFGELVAWQQYGLPSLDTPLEESLAYRLMTEYENYAQMVEAGKTVEPWQELLFGSGYGRGTTSPLVTGEILLEEANTARLTQRRLQAWPMVQQWLESEEGRAYGEIIEEIAKLRSVGVLAERQNKIMEAVEAARKSFLVKKGLSEVVRERTDLFTAGQITLGDWEREFFVPVTSPRDIYQRMRSFIRRAAAATEANENVVYMAMRDQLAKRGIIADSDTALSLATALYDAARSGHLDRAVVEMRHIPTITTRELGDEFVDYVKRNVLVPMTRIAKTPEELERIITEDPWLATRLAKWETAIQQLDDQGLRGAHLLPWINVGAMGVEPAQTVAEDIDTSLVETLIKEADVLRGSEGRVTRSALENRGLKNELDMLMTSLYREIGQDEQPFFEALGWKATGTALAGARIPVFHKDFPGQLFMRELRDFSPDELQQIATILGSQRAPLYQQTSVIVNDYLSAINQATKDKAAAVASVGGSSARQQVASTIRSINQGIKVQAATVGAGTAQAQPVASPGLLSTIDDLLPGRWKLIAGIGLAAATVGFAMKHQDKELLTMEGRPLYEQGVLPLSKSSGGGDINVQPYRRPVVLEEDEPGYRIRVRGRSRHPIDPDLLGEEISDIVQSLPDWQGQININTRHDSSRVDEQFAKDVFSKLLKQGYVT